MAFLHATPMLRTVGPIPPSTEDDALVVVGRFIEPFDAHIAAGALEAAGVVAIIQLEHLAGLHAPLAVASGGALVLVPRRDLARALLVLEGSAAQR